jgi:hypothetical protein
MAKARARAASPTGAEIRCSFSFARRPHDEVNRRRRLDHIKDRCGQLERQSVAEIANRGWLGNLDSNQDKQSQSLLCYRYTIPQRDCLANSISYGIALQSRGKRQIASRWLRPSTRFMTDLASVLAARFRAATMGRKLRFGKTAADHAASLHLPCAAHARCALTQAARDAQSILAETRGRRHASSTNC